MLVPENRIIFTYIIIDTVSSSFPVTLFKFCIGTEVDISNIDIQEVGVVCIGTTIIAFWSEHRTWMYMVINSMSNQLTNRQLYSYLERPGCSIVVILQ
jgi:hypothetical protein